MAHVGTKNVVVYLNGKRVCVLFRGGTMGGGPTEDGPTGGDSGSTDNNDVTKATLTSIADMSLLVMGSKSLSEFN